MSVLGVGPVVDTGRAEGAAAALRSTTAVRERARQLLGRARQGESRWFTVHDDALPTAAEEVVDVTRVRYPDLKIPFHSRWRHFEAGGVDRKAELDERLKAQDTAARARAMIDLAVVSVLLDAGAGPDWQYHEEASGQGFARSEGLGVASWHAFAGGIFSSDATHPLRVDADGLRALRADRLADAFQVGPANPLVGLEGRVLVLRRLGEALAAQPEVFGPQGRPGGLFDALVERGPGRSTGTVAAHDILSQLLTSMSGIWPAGNAVGTLLLGDCWRHEAVSGPGLTDGWMPFHKLSQWLSYSLLEPFQWAGVQVVGLDALTGLPEYRNGGLLLDTGVLRLRDPAWAARSWTVSDEVVVEWRALTVSLLDELAPLVRDQLGVDDTRMPLACVLEGGTWAAGRALAQRLRGGLPPLSIFSDGTVF
ncbi:MULTISPECIES: URC4/urg3 family protein [unclassified Rhodococcus (in: high G+C Gram-positive bacteria)]|uniref:URC4/urg3 family protein n=1 Tax=unclassified Rhodococcus (in: high G+C Gram-positive bacteria) TaxID=192944 RepID=UPI00163B4786|nr:MULTISPECIES: URC4/urg3 family protein [unclassified Rhodococcus (in: high G+C Gram-positive bacteria)]MBC2638066.1 URC4/urg3 family protein [Rhodococcus sp. 3A]MBC2897187.1 URC4/urg3 family protein [Rhodococcus sp. 4CII]